MILCCHIICISCDSTLLKIHLQIDRSMFLELRKILSTNFEVLELVLNSKNSNWNIFSFHVVFPLSLSFIFFSPFFPLVASRISTKIDKKKEDVKEINSEVGTYLMLITFPTLCSLLWGFS